MTNFSEKAREKIAEKVVEILKPRLMVSQEFMIKESEFIGFDRSNFISFDEFNKIYNDYEEKIWAIKDYDDPVRLQLIEQVEEFDQRNKNFILLSEENIDELMDIVTQYIMRDDTLSMFNYTYEQILYSIVFEQKKLYSKNSVEYIKHDNWTRFFYDNIRRFNLNISCEFRCENDLFTIKDRFYREKIHLYKKYDDKDLEESYCSINVDGIDEFSMLSIKPLDLERFLLADKLYIVPLTDGSSTEKPQYDIYKKYDKDDFKRVIPYMFSSVSKEADNFDNCINIIDFLSQADINSYKKAIYSKDDIYKLVDFINKYYNLSKEEIELINFSANYVADWWCQRITHPVIYPKYNKIFPNNTEQENVFKNYLKSNIIFDVIASGGSHIVVDYRACPLLNDAFKYSRLSGVFPIKTYTNVYPDKIEIFESGLKESINPNEAMHRRVKILTPTGN